MRYSTGTLVNPIPVQGILWRNRNNRLEGPRASRCEDGERRRDGRVRSCLVLFASRATAALRIDRYGLFSLLVFFLHKYTFYIHCLHL